MNCDKPDVRFSSTRDGLKAGVFAGVTLGENPHELVLERSAGGSHRRQGAYLSVPLATKNSRSLDLVWRPRWTTPAVWRKHANNPVLTPSPAPFWDAGSLTTASVVRVNDTLRLYYGSRPRGIGLAFAALAALHQWKKHPAPVLGAGPSGAFDAAGVNSPKVVPITSKHWHMYYVGYHPTEKWGGMPVHQIGLVESDDAGLTWRRRSNQPVIPHGDRGDCDAFSTSSASVLRIGGRWFLWYGGIAQVPYLAGICLATSRDGHVWTKHPRNPVLGFNPHLRAEAFVVAKPHVLYEEGVFKMWYSARGFGEGCSPGEYRICYAESSDGVHWERFPNNPVLLPSASGWDRKMVEYAEVLRDGGRYHLWYCGDGYGSIGYARGEATARVTMQTRSGPTPRPDRKWSDWSMPHPRPEGSVITVPPRGFLQFRLTLKTRSPDWSPVVQDIQLLAAS